MKSSRRNLLLVGATAAITGCNGQFGGTETRTPTRTPNRRVSVTFRPVDDPKTNFDGQLIDAYEGLPNRPLAFDGLLFQDTGSRHMVRFRARNRGEDDISYCPSWWWLYYRPTPDAEWTEVRHGALYFRADFLLSEESHDWGVTYWWGSEGVEESGIAEFEQANHVYGLPARMGEYLFGVGRFDSIDGDRFAVLSRFEIQPEE